MNISHALSSFLLDKDYYISLFDDKVYVFKYYDLSFLSSKKIILKMTNFDLIILGNSLSVIKLNKEEALIQGLISEVKKEYA